MDEERYRAVLTDLQQVVGGNPLEFDEHGVCYLVWEGAGTRALRKEFLLNSIGISMRLAAVLPDPLLPDFVEEVLERAFLAWDGGDCLLAQTPDGGLEAQVSLPLAAWEQEGPARLLDRFGERAHSLSALLADEADKADTFRTEKEFIPSFALRV